MIVNISTSHVDMREITFDAANQLPSGELLAGAKRLENLDVEAVTARTGEGNSSPVVDRVRLNALRQSKGLHHVFSSVGIPLRIVR